MFKINKTVTKQFDRSKLFEGDDDRVLSGSTCPNCQCASCQNCDVCQNSTLANISDYIKEVYLIS